MDQQKDENNQNKTQTFDSDSQKKEKHLRDFSAEEIYMVKLMAKIFVKYVLDNKENRNKSWSGA